MSFIYIASPYTHTDPAVMEQRYKEAVYWCAFLTNQRKIVYSPVVHWHPIAVEHKFPRDHEYWLAHDELFVSLSSRICVLQLQGWKESKGVKNEIELALKYGKDVTYIIP